MLGFVIYILVQKTVSKKLPVFNFDLKKVMSAPMVSGVDVSFIRLFE